MISVTARTRDAAAGKAKKAMASNEKLKYLRTEPAAVLAGEYRETVRNAKNVLRRMKKVLAAKG